MTLPPCTGAPCDRSCAPCDRSCAICASPWPSHAAVPDTLGALGALVSLKLAENRLTALPATLGALTTLTHLDASKNPLAALPATLGRLQRLVELRVSSVDVRVHVQMSKGISGCGCGPEGQHSATIGQAFTGRADCIGLGGRRVGHDSLPSCTPCSCSAPLPLPLPLQPAPAFEPPPPPPPSAPAARPLRAGLPALLAGVAAAPGGAARVAQRAERAAQGAGLPQGPAPAARAPQFHHCAAAVHWCAGRMRGRVLWCWSGCRRFITSHVRWHGVTYEACDP